MHDKPIETIKFDLLGQRRLEFDGASVSYQAKEFYPVALPGVSGIASSFTRGSIPLADVCWIGIILKRQWWALAAAIFGFALGIPWIVIYFGDWGPFAACVVFFVLFGLAPLAIFLRGRRFLAIASATEYIAFPADRKRKQVRKAVETLRKSCPKAEFALT